MTAAAALETVKRALPSPLKDAIKATGRRALSHRAPVRHAPPRGYHLEDYASWFSPSAEVFRRYLQRADLPPRPGAQRPGRIGLVVTPWVNTPVPWYAVMLGIGLALRGREVTLLWDDSAFPERERARQQQCIAKVLAVAVRYLPVTNVCDVHRGVDGAAAKPGDPELVTRLTEQNVVWALRGEAPTPAHAGRIEAMRRALSDALPHVRQALRQGEFEVIIVPGGVYGTSGLFVNEARALGCRVATFDTDRHIAQVCVDGVAAQNADIPIAFDSMWHGQEGERRHAVTAAQAELRVRSDTGDDYGFQVARAKRTARQAQQAQQAPQAEQAEGCVLIPLNVEWDTAALGRHIHFESTAEWIVSTVRTILDLDAGPIVVRQHPSERRKMQRSRLDVGALIKNTFGGDSRCRFIAASDPVSSYDLLQSSRLVLPYVSTIGIEAAAMGKPVLISGGCYYADLGFVWSAGSREEYFRLLGRGLRGDLPLRQEQAERAWLCYYLTAVQNRVPTDFTPHPDDFWSWCGRSPAALFSDPVVTDILEALDSNVPLSLLRHERERAGRQGAEQAGKAEEGAVDP